MLLVTKRHRRRRQHALGIHVDHVALRVAIKERGMGGKRTTALTTGSSYGSKTDESRPGLQSWRRVTREDWEEVFGICSKRVVVLLFAIKPDNSDCFVPRHRREDNR